MNPTSKYLSKREQEVVELLLKGKSNKQIALALGIAESTVEFHLKNVYAKLKVNSRIEAILKLGKSTGLTTENLRESIVERKSEINHTSGKFILWKRWLLLIKETISMIKEEIDMKNRLLSYFFAGLGFGILFWFYFGAIGKFMNRFSINEENALAIWAFLSIEFLFIFCVWLIPTLFPVRYEFRHSKKISLSVVAVIVMWLSAVLGYYLTYVVLLAFVGLPNMEYYLVFGQHGPAFWHDWAELFPRLILFKFLQWTIVGAIVGGFAGFITSSLYSFWVRKTNTILPA
ncbi:MAG TPA: helix-turn-helix transcriptional regulator [Anaerolineales bacterium]|nr:helix-turn-helix transcriptional regulator [Anaerolineales bacterium]